MQKIKQKNKFGFDQKILIKKTQLFLKKLL